MVPTIKICSVVENVCIPTPKFNKTDLLSLITKASFLQRKRLELRADYQI